jgi:hypothetical protein
MEAKCSWGKAWVADDGAAGAAGEGDIRQFNSRDVSKNTLVVCFGTICPAARACRLGGTKSSKTFQKPKSNFFSF